MATQYTSNFCPPTVVAVIVADELVVAFTFPIQVASFVVTLPEIVQLIDHLTLWFDLTVKSLEPVLKYLFLSF